MDFLRGHKRVSTKDLNSSNYRYIQPNSLVYHLSCTDYCCHLAAVDKLRLLSVPVSCRNSVDPHVSYAFQGTSRLQS